MRLDTPVLRRALLRWYQAHKRDLPWRHTQDPYAILVSELMLQQTQVKTALPFYGKFLKLFPNAKKLAAASEEQVLAAWAGLGYYRRARFLHAAAKAITEARRFPDTLEGIRALPGVGEYTAAAVGSIAFGIPAAVVDGNVIRVMARLLALQDDASKGAGAAAVRETAQALLDERHPGDFNQAVMELGATVCTPTKPACPSCPLHEQCAAFLSGQPEAYPKLPERAATQVLHKLVILGVHGKGGKARVMARLRDGKKDSVKKGQAADRLHGFWAFPELELKDEDLRSLDALVIKHARRLLGKDITLAGRLPKLRHSITVYDIHLNAYWFRLDDAVAKIGWTWVSLEKLATLPLASAEKKLLMALQKALSTKGQDEGQLGLGI